MKIAIHEKRFIRESSLVSENDSFAWKSRAPEDAYIIGNAESKMSVDPVFELLEKNPPNLIDPKNIKAFKS